MLVDTHCHLTDPTMSGENLHAVLQRAHDAGVGTIICPTADPADIDAALCIASTHENVFATIGIHPEYAGADAATSIITTIETEKNRIIFLFTN